MSEPAHVHRARERVREQLGRSRNGHAHAAGDLPERPPPQAPAGWQPFPVEALPEPARSFAVEAGLALGADPAFVALPLLAAIGAAVGNTRRVALKRDWTEPPVLWTVTVGESGTLKSPALDLALEFARERQRQAFAEHKAALERWTCSRKEDRAASEPPNCERFLAGDVTLEALACRLADSPRGLLLARDELAGWVRSFDAYRKGRGGDLAHYLTLHRAGDLILDRKTGERDTLFVPRAFLAITGGVQPGVLRRVLTPEFFEAGLPARFLLAMPPRVRRQWTEAEIHPDTRAAMARVFEALWQLAPEDGADGPRPRLVQLDREAKRMVWIPFFDAHAAEQSERVGDLAAAWSKLEGYCARLALIVHLCRWAAGDQTLADPDGIDAASIQAAVALVRWFGRETERVYAVLNATEAEAEQWALVELVRGRGGSITPRDLQRANRRYPTADAAEHALEGLAKAGWATAEQRPASTAGGRPTTAYRLR